MRTLKILTIVAASAVAQDTSSSATECAAYTASSPVTAATIQDIQQTYDATATPSVCLSGSSYPSTRVGEYLEITCVVTAVGTTKDAYNNGYYYCQMTGGETEWAGIEVFKDAHTHAKGDLLTIKGVPRETYGLTEFVECFSTKTGTGALPTPIAITTDTFDGCSLAAEKYEGMLVQTDQVTVQPCENALTTALVNAGKKSAFYCQANLENLAWGQCFDKYKQMWVKSTGGNTILEVDNHAVELAVEYTCATSANTFATWTSITGVMTYAYNTWDLIPRDKFDVVGGTGKTPSTVGAVTTSIPQILQTTNKFGNADTSNYGPSAVPQSLLGTAEVNSDNLPGFGGYAQAQPDAPWTTGSCPPFEILDWMDDAGNKTQNLCSCYPPNFYDPSIGQGSGTTYVTVTGVIQGIKPSDPEGPFYICDESCPSAGGCMFTYRRSSTQLNLGDKVQMTAKVYAYYGLNQFSYPIDITVITAGQGTCTPTVTDSVAPFTYEAGCNAPAEQAEATEMSFECLKVVMVGTDVDGDGTQGDSTYHLQSHSCYPGGSKQYHCVLKVEDVHGNQMLVDDGTFGDGTTCLFAGDCPGYTGKMIAVGDTFDAITGFVDQRRGSHMTGADKGGYYGLMPHKTGGFNGWSSDGWSATCQAKIDAMSANSANKLDESTTVQIAVGAAIGGTVVGGLIIYLVLLKMGKLGGTTTTTAVAKSVTQATVAKSASAA